MGTILGKGFPQAQVHTEFIARVLVENAFPKLCPHGKIAFSNSTCFYNVLFCFTTYAQQKKEEKKNHQIVCLLWRNDIL